ncbi:hypothetical protein HYU10_03180 [Candidatus Woesearchaeota archaeon]|nr:hypothetical protein [Candidatus Woesearchaeota archaeon]
MAWLIVNELLRKATHIIVLLILFVYASIEKSYSKQAALFFVLGLLGLLLIVEYLRLELGWRIGFINRIIRPKEEHRLCGAVYFLIATVIALGVLDFRIAVAALLMTTFGDMVASIAGKTIGNTLIYRSKTWAGFLSELAVNFAVGIAVLNNIYIIIGMTAVATVAEVLVEELDDNLIIPLFAGFAGQLIKFAL